MVRINAAHYNSSVKTVVVGRTAVHQQRRLLNAAAGASDDDGLDGDNKKKAAAKLLYLHIGPSGDCWTGASIFAAKHLQPDYVKSIALPDDFSKDDNLVEALLEAIEKDPAVQTQLYDNEQIPLSLLQRVKDATER